MQLHRAQALSMTQAQRQQALHSSSLAAQLRYIVSRHDSCNPESSGTSPSIIVPNIMIGFLASAGDVEWFSHMTKGAHVLSKNVLQKADLPCRC